MHGETLSNTPRHTGHAVYVCSPAIHEDNCFTILWWFLPYINISQPQVYMCPLPFEPPSYLPPHPTLLGCQGALGLTSLYHAAKSHWLSILHMVMYMFLLPSNPER